MTTRPTQHDSHAPRTRGLRRTWPVYALALFGTLSLLIWTRLRVVGGVPRTAYADPDRQEPQGRPKAPLQAPTGAPSKSAQGQTPQVDASGENAPMP